MKSEPLIIERTLNAPVGKVWKAIIDKDQMKKWYFNIAEFKLELGFEFRFLAGKDENNQYLHICKITEIITNKKLAYNWHFDGYEGMSYVTFELFPEGDKTHIKLTHEGLETFPASNPDLAKGNFAEGWTYIIGTSLKEFVEK
jgi:uncharacterized protein YndB with AHSA1/START domain